MDEKLTLTGWDEEKYGPQGVSAYGDHDYGCQCDKCKVVDYAVNLELERDKVETLRQENARLTSALAWITGASSDIGEIVNLPQCVRLFAAINRRALEAISTAQEGQAQGEEV